VLVSGPAQRDRLPLVLRSGFWLGLLIVAVGLPGLAAALTGDLTIPHDDAFAYSRIAETFARTGSFRLVGWNHPFSFSQEVSLGPLASSLVVQQLLALVLAVVALVVTYAFLRAFLSEKRALLGTAVVAAFPGFGLLATSFMEDIPTYCATLLTLVVGTLAIRRRSLPWLTLAVLCGIWGFLTREQVAAALVAVLIAALIEWSDPRRVKQVMALGLAAGVVLVVAELWRQSLPNGQQPTVTFSAGTIYVTVVRAYFTFGLLMLPATLLRSDPRRWSHRVKVFVAAAAVFGLVFLVNDKTLILGNYLDTHGAYSSVLLGDRAVLPEKVMDVLQLLCVLGGALLAGELLAGLRRLNLTVGLFGAVTVLGTLLEIFAGEPTFDRFLLPLMPVAMIVVLRQPVRQAWPGARSASVATTVGMLALSAVITRPDGQMRPGSFAQGRQRRTSMLDWSGSASTRRSRPLTRSRHPGVMRSPGMPRSSTRAHLSVWSSPVR